MKNKVIIILLIFTFLLTACTGNPQSADNLRELKTANDSVMDQKCEDFINNFSQNYPKFELLDYISGSDENSPIQLVVVAKNKETDSSSTLFVLDNNGVGQVILASEYSATYRKQDRLKIDKNIISISLNLAISKEKTEIHDFNITVTQEENQGKLNTLYSSEEKIRGVFSE